jgi:hypothetical protein
MRGHQVQRFEQTLKRLFDQIDDELEDQYGGDFPLHPARSPRGTTGNRAEDGLFNIGASFTAGYGSESGRGYAVEIRLSTLTDVPDPVKQEIRGVVERRVRELLPVYFPDRELSVVGSGDYLKIVGDLRLS